MSEEWVTENKKIQKNRQFKIILKEVKFIVSEFYSLVKP